jgi:hypothetical protein
MPLSRRKRTGPASSILACGSLLTFQPSHEGLLRSGCRPNRLGNAGSPLTVAAPRGTCTHFARPPGRTSEATSPVQRQLSAEYSTCHSAPLAAAPAPAPWPAFAAKRLRRGLAIARANHWAGGGGHPGTRAPRHPHTLARLRREAATARSRHSPRESLGGRRRTPWHLGTPGTLAPFAALRSCR